MHIRKNLLAGVLAIACLAAGMASAELRLPAIFSDGMVLQQGQKLPVWGWADPGAAVTVRFAGQTKKTTATADGKWRITLDALPAAAAPGELTASAETGNAKPETRTIANVLVGEVWFCSGQSNMWYRVHSLVNAKEVVDSAKYPQMRVFSVKDAATTAVREDTEGKWLPVTPESIGDSSAVAYLFGRQLHQDLGVPVGLIESSWGGSPAEGWMSPQALSADPDFKAICKRYQEGLKKYPDSVQQEYERRLAAWKAQTGGIREHKDPGIQANAKGWEKPDLDTTGWRDVPVPSPKQQADLEDEKGNNIDGAAWFRREVEVPAAWADKELLLHLGAIDDFDITFFNGVKVGGIGPETQFHWKASRDYKIPAAVVKPGRTVIAVRMFDQWGGAGFQFHPVPMNLSVAGADGKDAIPLVGTWKYKVELALLEMPFPTVNPWNVPCCLYNAMLMPVVPYGIKGVIWYQGESNRDRAYQYRKLFPAMIRDWRAAWGQGDFPFLFVQIANYLARPPEPGESNMAELREAQMRTLAEPNTAMAVTLDIGDAKDIHPRNKWDVAARLALAAKALAYGEKSEYSGPLYSAMTTEEGNIRLRFTHTGSGLLAKGGDKLTGFAIAGEDRKFVWADATLDGDTVVVRSPQVPKPLAVRYAWADNPDGNLFNKNGLPASSFRTDDWPGLTAGKE